MRQGLSLDCIESSDERELRELAELRERLQAKLAADRSGYLESTGNIVEEAGWYGPWQEAAFELRPCGCKLWFCNHCCVRKGLKIRERLRAVLTTFKDTIFITLTVDPTLFESPAAAQQYLKDKRCVAEMMRTLFKSHHPQLQLHSRRYFYVVEWQKETEMPHFHIIVDASFVPFELVRDTWGEYRPAGLPEAEGNRPRFGSVRVDGRKFKSMEHAANYACKYLIKSPEHGYPEWLKDLPVRTIHRYGTSRGFWGSLWGDACEADGDASFDVSEVEAATIEGEECKEEQEPKASKPVRSIRQAMEQCGKETNVVRVVEEIKPDGEVIVKRIWVGSIAGPLDNVADSIYAAMDGRRAAVTWQQVLGAAKRWGWARRSKAMDPQTAKEDGSGTEWPKAASPGF